jgi:hypothetical protein
VPRLRRSGEIVEAKTGRDLARLLSFLVASAFLLGACGGASGSGTGGGDDRMKMGVKAELLTKGVQQAVEADLRTELSRIASHFKKCFGTGRKQEIVEDFLVLQN